LLWDDASRTLIGRAVQEMMPRQSYPTIIRGVVSNATESPPGSGNYVINVTVEGEGADRRDVKCIRGLVPAVNDYVILIAFSPRDLVAIAIIPV